MESYRGQRAKRGDSRRSHSNKKAKSKKGGSGGSSGGGGGGGGVYRGHRAHSAQISGANFRSASVIALGVVTVFAGIILLVAFGVPASDVSQDPKSVLGVLVIALGGAVVVVGSVYAYCQNRRKRRRLRARARFFKVRTLAQVAPAFKAKMFGGILSSSTVGGGGISEEGSGVVGSDVHELTVNEHHSSSPSAVSLVETVHAATDVMHVNGYREVGPEVEHDRLQDVF
jgi:hypothetical protein